MRKFVYIDVETKTVRVYNWNDEDILPTYKFITDQKNDCLKRDYRFQALKRMFVDD